MQVYLYCPTCKTRETVDDHSIIGPCPQCRAARWACGNGGEGIVMLHENEIITQRELQQRVEQMSGD